MRKLFLLVIELVIFNEHTFLQEITGGKISARLSLAIEKQSPLFRVIIQQ